MKRLKLNILKVLKSKYMPQRGIALNAIRLCLPYTVSHERVLEALHELLNEKRVRRTPVTCLWKLA